MNNSRVNMTGTVSFRHPNRSESLVARLCLSIFMHALIVSVCTHMYVYERMNLHEKPWVQSRLAP